ncbi:MAG: hypothetical protein IJV37_09490 [Bacteroidales bacterium]|nr:hypothetical protein [Bacteroidales bacterium]
MKKLIFWLPAVLLAGACNGGALDPVRVMVDAEGNPLHHEMIVLGDQLDDPYSVDNMTEALASVYPTKAGRVVLPATDLYVRFLPADEREYDILTDLGLALVDHPVDYEILREGDYYHDPALEEDRITWQYAVVPADFDFPAGIRYELLERCYIPRDGTKSDDGVDWEAVEREAFRLTGNAGLLQPATKGESGTPAGRITIVDRALGGEPEGVRGVRVSCNTFVKFAHAYTDADGNYRMTRSFTSNPRYRLVFNNSTGFSIGFNLLLIPASVSTLGKNAPTGLDAEITEQSDRKLFSRCVVNNAGYDYYKRCKEGTPTVKTPPANLRLWLFQGLESSCAVMLQQGVLIDGSKLAEFLGEFTFLVKIFLPDITLGLKGKETYAEIYAEALHEFAHASHFMLAGKNYWNNYVRFVITSFVSSGFVTYGVGTEENFGHCEVGEMWAYFAQSLLYRERYGETGETFGLSHWFHPQILLQLEERGLSFGKIFQVLTSDVTDRETLQKKLISYYPEYKSAINQIFARYN